ncbi:glutathione-disulfide reductase [Agarilytica rhodophyticola]|uniref:glutathione-disulfide reductase n=1 Tax=Agarilytica rhodophyticola TaxID=1737490 RepID=UPI000B348B68|nr:glutathione-disulfide reductase [Agarilytica rhodophyticola]
MNYDYDLFVIGAGSGGVRASRIASQLGAKVAVAEDRYLGGTCVNVGCVPKKLFVYSSEYAKSFKDAAGFGWAVGETKFQWDTLRDNKTAEIERLNGIYGNILENAGVELINGHASIVDPHTVKVGEKNYTAKYILVAVGGWPRKPSFPGGEHTIDSNDVFYLKDFPEKVLVQGGGYIAVEFAGIFNGLGCDTELLYRGPLFLRGFDEEIRRFVSSEVEKSGVNLSFNTDIEKIDKRDDGKLDVQLNNGETRTVDAVFSAVGRVPKTEGLGLENTAVQFNKTGEILVNENFQTDEPSIYALGDVVGRKTLTPVALAEGMALARHLFRGDDVTLSYKNIATAVFCQPNIATLGVTEEEAQATGKPYAIFSSEFKPLKNTVSGSEQRTLMKLIVDKESDKVIGAHMAGPDAGEIIQGLAIAVKAGATKQDFDETIGIHPTSAEEYVTMRESAREGNV